jgi:hypothetical protein
VFSLLATIIILTVCLFLSKRGRRRDSDGEVYGIEHETAGSFEWDPLTSELSGRIFDRKDADFVASESSRQITRQFRRERTALALDWLRAVRDQVNQLARAHFRASRENHDLKPADEIRLWVEFLLFQLTSGILYLVIWVCGPSRAAALFGYSLELVAQLQKVTEDILPAGRQVTAELMNNDREAKSGDAAG